MNRLPILLLGLILLIGDAPCHEKGLVACWDFNEGSGDILHDRSGNENHGRIYGAKWVDSGTGYALLFDGVDDHVDCGTGETLDITGPITLQAWIQPTAANRGEPLIAGKHFSSYALTYYGSAYWYISSGGNNSWGPVKIKEWSHLTGSFDGESLRFYINGLEVSSSKSKFSSVNPGGRFLLGFMSAHPNSVDPKTRGGDFFPGIIDSVKVYNRALSESEILEEYNSEAREKGLKTFNTSVLGKFVLEPFYYPDEDRAVLSVNFRWALPVAEGSEMVADLVRAGSDISLQSKVLNPDSPRWEDESTFQLNGLLPGEYRLRAQIRLEDKVLKSQETSFQYPFDPPAPVPFTSEFSAAPLPPAVMPPDYQVAVSEGGGIQIECMGQTYLVESNYSFPHGGSNELVAGAPSKNGEATWQVEVDAPDFRVQAKGEYYSVSRTIEQQETRVLVKDTFKNLSDDVVGIILSNQINVANLPQVQVTQMSNPTVFVASGDGGLGLIALDDIYQLQQTNFHSENLAGIRTEHFGIDKDASYTIEWAIYPTSTRDYYDFINWIRVDERLNRRVEGAFAFVDRRTPPSKELVELKNLAYSSIACLGNPPDDPSVSLEGFEFPNYPQEASLLKQTFVETKRMHPGLSVMFHVAHSLYATDKPDQLFPDSRAIDENGNQIHYGPNTMEYYGKYFSEERVNEGWRWWIFYPTLENSFGKAMIEATEFMLEELGATGMWADGYISGYVPGSYTYDCWDGHSVTIDPETKLVTRKKAHVTYMALPVLKKVARMISEKGGTLITNGLPGPRSFWNEDVITSGETGGGDQRPISGLYLGRTINPLGNTLAIQNERDIYRDILTKLDLGSLYFWYGEGDLLAHKTLVEHMYPITLHGIHRGTVRGKERIITKVSDTYGWQSDSSLHKVFLYDARGALTRNSFVTSVNEFGSRTEVSLAKDQAAVVERLPINLRASWPVNVLVRKYDAGNLEIDLNGRARAELRIANGKFPIVPGIEYQVTIGYKTRDVIADAKKGLRIPLDLAGEVRVVVSKKGREENKP